MSKIFLRYRLNRSAVSGYITAAWGSSNAFPVKRVLDDVVQELAKKDKQIILDIKGDSTDPKNFPEEFVIGRTFEDDEIYTASLKQLVDVMGEAEFSLRGLPYDLTNKFIED